MRPKPPAKVPSEDLFRSCLEAILDQRHELVRLAALINWARFDEAFVRLYVESREEGLACRPGS